jgi:hypothetical protein
MPEPHEQELASGLVLAEYQSVREEWLAARTAQHQTWQWSIAAIAVLLAATVGANARAQHSWLYVAGAAGAATFAIASQVIWLGELLRMERAALFLRGRELVLNRALPRVAGESPLLFETWRANRPVAAASPWIPGAGPLIVAGLALYAATACVAVAVLVTAAVDAKLSSGVRAFAWAASGLGTLAYLAVALYTCRLGIGLWHVRREPADLSEPD